MSSHPAYDPSHVTLHKLLNQTSSAIKDLKISTRSNHYIG